MLSIVVTELVFQSPIAWLKLLAPSNINAIVVAELVIQAPIAWLKLLAYPNSPRIVVTELVSQSPIDWLKLLASSVLEKSLTPRLELTKKFLGKVGTARVG